MTEDLTKFVEGLKGAELTASEYVELGSLVMDPINVFWGFVVVLFIGLIIGVIIGYYNS